MYPSNARPIHTDQCTLAAASHVTQPRYVHPSHTMHTHTTQAHRAGRKLLAPPAPPPVPPAPAREQSRTPRSRRTRSASRHGESCRRPSLAHIWSNARRRASEDAVSPTVRVPASPAPPRRWRARQRRGVGTCFPAEMPVGRRAWDCARAASCGGDLAGFARASQAAIGINDVYIMRYMVIE